VHEVCELFLAFVVYLIVGEPFVDEEVTGEEDGLAIMITPKVKYITVHPYPVFTEIRTCCNEV